MPETLVSALSGIVAAMLLFAGTRYVAKQSRTVSDRQLNLDERKVDQEAFDRFITRYEAERERTKEELRETRSLLRAALRHINSLRGEMRRVNVIPPALPDELQHLPWHLYDPDRSG